MRLCDIRALYRRALVSLIVAAGLLGYGTVEADGPAVQWEKTFGGPSADVARSVQQTSDGGYIIVGWTESYGVGSRDVYLIKTDATGNMKWQKTFGGSGYDDGFSVQQTSDGGYIVVGYTASFGYMSDVYLIKTDSEGDLVWQKPIGGTEAEEGHSIQETPDGGYIIIGYTCSYGTGGSVDTCGDVWLVKADSGGNVDWHQTWGGSGTDGGNGGGLTSDGGYIIAAGTYSFGAGGWDAWLIKTDSSGKEQWKKTFGGSSDDGCSSVQQTSDGGYILAGSTRSFGAGDPYGDLYLIRTDSAGNTVWEKNFGGNASDVGVSAHQTPDGGYIAAGWTQSFGTGDPYGDVYLVRTDSAGNMLWQTTFGGSSSDAATSFQPTSDGGYIIAGLTYSFGAGGADVYLIKLAPDNYRFTTPDVTIYPTQTYSVATCILTLSADVTDTLCGKVTSGSFSYILKDSASSQKVSGNLTYNTATGKWTASQTITPGLSAGNYTISYNVVSAQGRTGSATGQVFVESTFNLSGKVKDGKTGAAMSAVQIAVAGQSTQTNSQGQYSFTALDASQALTLTATKTGYATYTTTLSPPSSGISIVHDFDMQPVGELGKPVVTGVSAKYNGIFLAGLSINNDYTATVEWNGTPGTVEFYANDTLKITEPGTTTGATATFNMGVDFPGAFSQTANNVRVIARNSEGSVSDVFEKPVIVIPLVPSLEIIAFLLSAQPSSDHICADFSVELPIAHDPIDLPVLGKFGVEFAANASFDYTLSDGDWEAAFGVGAEGKQGKRGRRPTIPGVTRYPKMKLYIGNKEIEGKIQGGAKGTATVTNGITFDEVFARGEISAKLELGRVGLLDLLGPGLSSAVAPIPFLGDFTGSISIIIYVEPEVEGELVFALDPQFAFKQLEIAGDVGLEAAYEPKLPMCEMRLYVGGKPGVTFQTPGPLIKELRFRAYAGAEFRWWIITIGPFEYVFVNVTIPGKSGMEAATQTFVLVPAASNSPKLRPIDRSYLANGPPRFVAYEEPLFKANSTVETLSPLEAFRIIGRQGSNRQLSLTEAKMPAQMPIIVQADLALVKNLFTYTEPALAGYGNELMLLCVSDNGAPGDLKFTDINWLRFDGTNWTEPAPIATDTRAEFAPEVAFDGEGNAIGVWERVKDSDFNTLDIYAMAKEVEIVYSQWDYISQIWSPPTPITDNNYLDHNPVLCGPMGDGSVLAVWTENQANLLMGDSNSPSTALWSKWDPASDSWSAPEVLVDGLICRLSESLSGTGDKAIYAWTADLDGDVNTPDDEEVFVSWYGDANWAEPLRLTEDVIPDRNVRVAVADDNDVYLVWQRAGDLVMDHNSTGISLVRENSQTVAFTDYAMTLGPQGNLVLVWEEQSQTGVDAFYSVYDPASGRWSKDNQIFADAALERSFAPVWDDVGNLTITYNRVEIEKTNKVVELETGEIVEVNDVPTPGRVDLGIVKRILIKDLSIQAGDFTAEGTNYLPGDQVRLRAEIHNAGDLAIEDLTVAFYDGDPLEDGVEIGRQTISGWLDGADTAYSEVTWIVPEPAKPRTLYAELDPNSEISEINENNNTLSLGIGGTDLGVRLLSSEAQEDGSARIVAEVHNAGAPSAPESVLAIRKAGQGGAAIATSDVPELTPGRVAQVALDLPAGAVLPGNMLFTVTVDDANQVQDIDREDNSLTFPVYFPLLGDVNLDGVINMADLAVLAEYWLGTYGGELPWWGKPDLDNSGDIGFDDIAIISENWLWQAN